ncbi:MAG: YtzH-like family protein [Bacillus sp. (in: firmicutes)]
MPLSQLNQLSILRDILSDHQSDCCGSVAECEQVERLVKSLLANGTDYQHLAPVLTQIYEYSQNGVNTSDLDSHITAHQEELSGWLSDIDTMF